MNYDIIIVRIGETYLKAKWTKRRNMDILSNSIRAKTGISPERMHGYLMLKWFPEFMKLAEIPGIESFSPAVAAGTNKKEIIDAVVKYGKSAIKGTFKIKAKRLDKSLPFSSREIEKEAGEILEADGFTADMRNPETTINVRIGKDTLIYHQIIKGMGGFPVGSNGKAIALVSGGIDSAVAAYLMIKKGVAVHPMIMDMGGHDIEKFMDICSILGKFQAGRTMKCFSFPAPEIRKSKHSLLALRRILMQVASAFALKGGYDFIITGDSLGQVASQTPDNIKYLTSFSSVPVIRPLISFDKNDIIKIAKGIGTYKISVRTKGMCEQMAKQIGAVTKPGSAIESIVGEISIDNLVEKIKEL